MKEEIWKAVEGYEGWYEVSSYGRVRSLDRIVAYSDGKKCLWKGRILKPNKDRYGYLICDLRKNSRHKSFKVHRLVAQTFIPNPNNLPEVNHKDENKANNCVFVNKDGSVDLNKSNLEWCSHLYNINYGTCIQRRTETQSMTVLQLDINTGHVVSEYSSAKEAARQLNIYQGNISNCCNGKCKSYKGFKWQYKE